MKHGKCCNPSPEDIYNEKEDEVCTTHHMCNCIQERLDRIEAVWQRYKHMDRVLCDTEILDIQHDITDLVLYDLWRAIRRDE